MRKWQADIRSQQRALERQIRDLERDRKNAEKQVREAAKRGDMKSAKMLAKEIVHTKKVCSLCMGGLLKHGTLILPQHKSPYLDQQDANML